MPLDIGGVVCPEEKVAQSDARFGVVRDEETLARIVRPAHMVGGKVDIARLFNVDQLQKSGWSLIRKDHVNDGGIPRLVKRLDEKIQNPREYAGYAQIQTADVRAIQDAGRQALCVIDVDENFEEHALIKESKSRSRSATRKIRKKMHDSIRVVLANASDNLRA